MSRKSSGACLLEGRDAVRHAARMNRVRACGPIGQQSILFRGKHRSCPPLGVLIEQDLHVVRQVSVCVEGTSGGSVCNRPRRALDGVVGTQGALELVWSVASPSPPIHLTSCARVIAMRKSVSRLLPLVLLSASR